MIPQSTTLAERLEFYEFALRDYGHFICNKGCSFYNDRWFNRLDIKRLFPELYKHRDKSLDKSDAMWLYDDPKRIEALKKAKIFAKQCK